MTQTSGAGFSADKPFFRYDLQTEAVEDGGQRFVDVTDPDGGASFRFFEVEYAVACGMDGERDLQGLVTWAKSELDLKTTTEELDAIVSKLSELSYLGGDVAAPAPAVAPLVAATPVAAPPVAAPPVAATPVVAPPVVAPPVAAPPVVQDVVAAMPEIATAPPSVDRDSGIDVALGNSGKSPLREELSDAPADAADVELGVAGVGDVAVIKPDATDDPGMLLGAAGNEESVPKVQEVQQDTVSAPSNEVSTDLSQTFRIDQDEVKAAVRASKVMSAVEVPKELEDELAAARGKAEEDAKADAIPENVAPVADISDSIANEAAENDGGAAIVLPDAPAKVAAAAADTASKKPGNKKELGPKRNSASMVLWVILLLAAAAGAGYYYMEYVREQPDEKSSADTPRQAATRIPAAPAAPKAPSATLEVSEIPTADIKVGRAGVVAWVVEASSEVAVGDEVVKLSGYERADKTIERHNKSLASYEAQLAGLSEGSSRTASIAANVARKKLDIELANGKRAAFVIRAPIAGVVETVVDVRGRVAAAQVVGNVTGSASATVSFTLPKGVSVVADDALGVVSKADAELKATCKVTAVTADSATLSCPADSGLSNGAEVELVLPGAAAPGAAAPEKAAPEEAAPEAAP